MNPYLQIARDHLTVEELELLLAEKRKPAPKKKTYEEQRKEHYRNLIIQSL